MIPNVSVTKIAFNTGVVAPSPVGVGAIIAAGSTGTKNQAAGFARDDLMLAAMGVPISEFGSYMMQVGGNQVVAVESNASIAGAYGAITSTPGTGTSAVTADGVSLPFDDYDVLITIVAGGTVGTAGITYTTSLDGGEDTSGVLALGTANSITIPGTGVKVNLGAGTLAAGATYQFFTSRPQPNNTDLTAALEALRQTRLPWEGVLIDAAYATGTVGVVDTWLAGLEAKGQFHFAVLNTRHKTLPVPLTETEAAYGTAMQNLTQNDASIRLCVGVDAADYTSTLSGVSQPRPTSMFLMARAMLIPVGEDPAFVGRGNLPGAGIADGSGNPRWHDEDLFPGLDNLRLVALRSFSPGGPQGVYINNANVLSPAGSDFVWLQHVRTANVACSIAWQILTGQLSIGVGKKPKDPVTGLVYILEQDAQKLEEMVNAGFATPLKKQVAAVQFKLSRTDDLSSNSSSTVNGTIEVVALAYLKNFKVTQAFVKSISVTV